MEAECNCAKISGCVISFSFSFLLFVDKKVYKFPITGKMLLSEVLGWERWPPGRELEESKKKYLKLLLQLLYIDFIDSKLC